MVQWTTSNSSCHSRMNIPYSLRRMHKFSQIQHVIRMSLFWVRVGPDNHPKTIPNDKNLQEDRQTEVAEFRQLIIRHRDVKMGKGSILAELPCPTNAPSMHLDIPEKFLTKHHIRGEVLRARANWFNFERPYIHANQIQYFKGPPFQGEPSAQLKRFLGSWLAKFKTTKPKMPEPWKQLSIKIERAPFLITTCSSWSHWLYIFLFCLWIRATVDKNSHLFVEVQALWDVYMFFLT